MSSISTDVFCQPAGWIDVLKFFLANYFSHVFTVIARPGDRTRDKACFMLWSLFMPFAGVGRAVTVIARYPRGAKDDLWMAHRAGALFTLVKMVRDPDADDAGKVWKDEPSDIILYWERRALHMSVFLPPLHPSVLTPAG